jgi:hypothetical protein
VQGQFRPSSREVKNVWSSTSTVPYAFMMSCLIKHGEKFTFLTLFFCVVKGPAADATDAPQPSGFLCNPTMKIISFFVFLCNGAPVE